jgi:hypothetical protein
LAATLPLATGCWVTAARAQEQPPPGAENLTHYQIGPHIWLRWNNGPLTSYRAHPTQKYPYFYPLIGPVSGLSLTSETALPWPHHRSLFFACDRVNGGNYWQAELETGQIISGGPRVGQATATSVEILDQCHWHRPGEEPQVADKRRFVVTVDGPRRRTIDADIEWIAVRGVTIERTNHALFSLRAAIDITPWGGGTLVSSEGNVGEAATFGKPARWCCFFGKRARTAGEVVEGIALFDHPQNPWPDCPWFTRDYGFISPMPFQWITEPWQMPAGQSVRLRYRVVLHAGDPAEAGLEGLYQQWVNETS